MAKDRVINSQSFHDGKVVIYQLENRPKQKWLCRLKGPERGSLSLPGYRDLYEARKFADNLYQDLLIKVKLGESLTGYDFKKLLSEFELNYPSEAPLKSVLRTSACFYEATLSPILRRTN